MFDMAGGCWEQKRQLWPLERSYPERWATDSVSLNHGEGVGRLGFGVQGKYGADLLCSVQLRWHESRAMTCLSLDVGGRGPKSWSRGHLGKTRSPVTSSCAPKSCVRAAYSGGSLPSGPVPGPAQSLSGPAGVHVARFSGSSALRGCKWVLRHANARRELPPGAFRPMAWLVNVNFCQSHLNYTDI
jgi:hypothetical protein